MLFESDFVIFISNAVLFRVIISLLILMYSIKTGDPLMNYKNAKKPLNILIVDDEDMSRDSLKDMIMLRKHNVTTLDEGMKCVNRCAKVRFDLIFMDYHINDLGGDLDGTDIISMVKGSFDIDSLIFAYTGDSSTEALAQFKKNGMQGALIKPVDAKLLDQFMDLIEQYGNDSKKLSRLAMTNKNFYYFAKPLDQIILKDVYE
jgi:CheY-like chemotaxis protein